MKKVKVLLTLLVLPVLLSGCIAVNGEFREARNYVLEGLDARFDKEVEFSIGPAGMALAGAVVSLADDENEAEDIIKNVSGVQVGVYHPETRGDFQADFDLISGLSEKLTSNGWYHIIKTCKDDEASGVYLKNNSKGRPVRLMVVSVQRDELAIVQVNGDLEKICEAAIRSRGLQTNHGSFAGM